MKKNLYKLLVVVVCLFSSLFAIERMAGRLIAAKIIHKNLPKFEGSEVTVGKYNVGLGKRSLQNVSYKMGDVEVVFKEIAVHRSLPSILFSKTHSYKSLKPAASECSVFYLEKELANFHHIHFDDRSGAIILYGIPKNRDDSSTIKIVLHVNQTPLVEVSLQNIKTDLMEKFIPDTPAQDIIGNHVSLKASFYPKESEIVSEVQFYSPNLCFTTAGMIKNGDFRLKQPLIGSFYLQESLSRHFFKEGSTRISSIDPALIHIDPENAVIPLSLTALEKLELPKITVDFGHLKCSSFYVLNALLSVMNLELDLSPSIHVQTQKTTFAIEHGVCKFQRTPFMVDNQYPLIGWGTYDLKTKYMDIDIGVSNPFLERSLNLKNVPKDFTISLKITGTKEKPVYHLEDAIANMAEVALYQAFPIYIPLRF